MNKTANTTKTTGKTVGATDGTSAVCLDCFPNNSVLNRRIEPKPVVLSDDSDFMICFQCLTTLGDRQYGRI